jgi:hypothetical protein
MDTLLSELGGPLERSAVDAGATDVVEPPTIAMDDEQGSRVLLDRAGRRRSPAMMPGFHAGRPPRNKGLRYPADPPKVEETIAVMRAAGDGPHGQRR